MGVKVPVHFTPLVGEAEGVEDTGDEDGDTVEEIFEVTTEDEGLVDVTSVELDFAEEGVPEPGTHWKYP